MLSISKTVVLSAVLVAAPAMAQRAMWSWYDDDIRTVALQNTMLDFAEANRVTVIYIHGESLLNNTPDLLADFINLAAARNIAIELLFGAPEWTLTANHNAAIELLVKANTFVSDLKQARPAGLHFDVEPHMLPNWAENRVSLGHQLVDLYAKLAREKAPDLYLNVDIAIDYEYVGLTRGGVNKTLSQWLIDITDRTTVMSYRNQGLGADSITDHATPPMDYAGSIGKLTVVGVETTCNLDPAKVTFCKESKTSMEVQLGSVAAFYVGNAGFGGFAIHDYRNFKILK